MRIPLTWFCALMPFFLCTPGRAEEIEIKQERDIVYGKGGDIDQLAAASGDRQDTERTEDGKAGGGDDLPGADYPGLGVVGTLFGEGVRPE